MDKNKKSKNNSIEKLRMVLDTITGKKLHPEDEKYLRLLNNRLKKTSEGKKSSLQGAIKTSEKEKDEDDYLKPRVTIHPRKEKKLVEFREAEKPKPEEKEAYEEEEVYEVEKVEVDSPEFVEVKPKELPKEEVSKEEIAEKVEKEITGEITEKEEEIKPEEKLPEWEPVEIQEKKVEKPVEEKAEFKEKKPQSVKKEGEFEQLGTEETFLEEIDANKQEKIDALKELKSVDEKTALLLYDQGYISIDDLKKSSLKDLKRIKGIKRKTAKKIKKEIEEKIEKAEEILPTEDEENLFFEEEQDKTDVFKDINSIDQKTAKLLYKNGINSIEILKETPIKKLKKIKGLKRKHAKQIKEEVSELPEEAEEDEFYSAADEETEEWDVQEFDDQPKSKPNLKENPFVEETEEEWDSFSEEEIPQERIEEKQGYNHGDYTLYKKEVKARHGKKRTVYFFAKAEPEDAEPTDLPPDYEVKINKKTGVPYLKKRSK